MKYTIQKTDGTPIDLNAVYFVLRLDKPNAQGVAARRAVSMYAEMVAKHDPEAAMAAANCAHIGQLTSFAGPIGNVIGHAMIESENQGKPSGE